jgi:uncharacterized protein YjbI with pentapeptide repeats
VPAHARAPKRPASPKSREPATPHLHHFADEATFRGLDFTDADLSGRAAESVEFALCRFANTDFGNTTLGNSTFTDCVFERGNLANLRTEKCGMRRVSLSILRMTGVHWVAGTLRDVTVAQCRADLTSFRFSSFRNVVFEDCNLTRADFQNADLTGVRFHGCDLTAAQFSHATMTGATLSNCELAGIGGVTSFAGAVVSGHDLVGLSYTLAAALGIRIEQHGQTA